MDAHTDDTCDPALTSWVASANSRSTDFPLQNLPLGIVRRRGEQATWGVAVAIGDEVLEVAGCVRDGVLACDPQLAAAVGEPTLNALLTLGTDRIGNLRRAV